MNLTKFILRRPLSLILCVLALVVFGFVSITGTTLELTPEMEMPMMLVTTVYVGASPDDVDELLSKPIEEAVDTLNGIDSVTSYSMENSSIVLLTYEYGTNMDTAYIDLKKKIDSVISDLPEDAKDPNIMEIDINDKASVRLSVKNEEQSNLYNYVDEKIVPEFEKIGSVASVDINGGQESYIKIELISEKLDQYHLSMNNLVSAIGSADFSYPAGNTHVGGLELSVSTSVSYDNIESLKKIPISTGAGSIIHLEDIANVYEALEDKSSISRYNGEDTISLDIKKQQSSSAVDVSKNVKEVIEKLTAADENLDIIVVSDDSEDIMASLKSVAETLVLAIAISMVVIFLFFGDLKASLIVGSSIPIAIFAALIMMRTMGFSLNVITLGALVLGVGMMVDNSIVILESCFRGADNLMGQETYFSGAKISIHDYKRAALDGSKMVLNSVIGSTVTTCVVFLPLAALQGMSGQLFKPLGFTIVFCMLASLISAITVVPLCYALYRPEEKENALANAPIKKMQDVYRVWIRSLLKKKKTVLLISVILLLLSFGLATQLDMKLMPAGDTGRVDVTIETRPGLTIDNVNGVLQEVEKVVAADKDIESYMLTYGGSGLRVSGASKATLSAYLSDDTKVSCDEIINRWKPEMNRLKNCNIKMEVGSPIEMTTDSSDYELILQSTQYDDLKKTSDLAVKDLMKRSGITKVHSTLENAAPVVKINVDPIKAAAEGLSPVQVAGTVRSMLSGVEATKIDVDSESISVMVEYAEDEYDTIDDVQEIIVKNATGNSIALRDIADISYKDSPQTIRREDKQYHVTISAEYTSEADKDTEKLLNKEMKKYEKGSVSIGLSAMDESMKDEFNSLFGAIAAAVFLIFIVMGIQFESVKFSIMVMTTIPFALIGSFGLLYLADVPISMTSLLGFLMLIGTVVNNGILYVDTVNQYKEDMNLKEAIIEAGATRMRPIFMTTLTTIVAMIPMALAYGENGEMMQGLALVNVGGLIASTALSLIVLPIYYLILNGKPRKRASMKERMVK